MIALDKELQLKKTELREFMTLSERILRYLPNIITDSKIKNDYIIFSSQIAGTIKYIRPINQNLFVDNPGFFIEKYEEMLVVLEKIKNRDRVTKADKFTIDSILYTIQQSIGAGMDLLTNPNSARKHTGNRFEELIKAIFTKIGIANKKLVLQIPYETESGIKYYKCENDLILSPYLKVQSTSDMIDKNEIVLSIKTTSKDRMGKMFIDKLLLEKFIKHPQKVIGVFLNDVQRKESSNISYTLVSGLFMVYTKFLIEMDGIYYLDPPPNAKLEPYNQHMKCFSELICKDIWELLAT